jgi:hypothetical protein
MLATTSNQKPAKQEEDANGNTAGTQTIPSYLQQIATGIAAQDY